MANFCGAGGGHPLFCVSAGIIGLTGESLVCVGMIGVRGEGDRGSEEKKEDGGSGRGEQVDWAGMRVARPQIFGGSVEKLKGSGLAGDIVIAVIAAGRDRRALGKFLAEGGEQALDCGFGVLGGVLPGFFGFGAGLGQEHEETEVPEGGGATRGDAVAGESEENFFEGGVDVQAGFGVEGGHDAREIVLDGRLAAVEGGVGTAEAVHGRSGGKGAGASIGELELAKGGKGRVLSFDGHRGSIILR